MGIVASRHASIGPSYAWVKRGFDLVAAAVLLVVALPVLAAGAVVIWAADGRPVFFGHLRVGRGGAPFKCWKFRTMVTDAESVLVADPTLHEKHRGNGYRLPTRDDPRVTRIGRFLRRTYLDELPQLVNVVSGEMSMVGPRPVVEDELVEFEPDVAHLLSVRPGIFGPWNVLGRSRPHYPERARIEVAYARAPGPARDIAILIRAVRSVAEGEPDA